MLPTSQMSPRAKKRAQGLGSQEPKGIMKKDNIDLLLE